MPNAVPSVSRLRPVSRLDSGTNSIPSMVVELATIHGVLHTPSEMAVHLWMRMPWSTMAQEWRFDVLHTLQHTLT